MGKLTVIDGVSTMTVIEQEQREVLAPVCLRADNGNWGVVAFLSLAGLTLLVLLLLAKASGDPAAGVLTALFTLMSLVPVFLGGYCQARTVIIADEDGLRWRRLRGWRVASWADVTGYYDQRTPGSEQTSRFAAAKWQRVVKTRAGTLTFDENEWGNDRQFRIWVRQRATSASIRSWGEMRKQPDDWPPVFHYNTAINQNMQRWLHHWHGIGLVAVVIYFGWAWETTHTLPGWGWLLTPTSLFFIGKQILLLSLRPTYRQTVPYLKRKVRANVAGLTFIDEDKRELIPWGEITDFYQNGLRSVIVTERGEWDFLSTLTGFESLRRIIRRYAVNAKPTEWHQRSRRRIQRDTAWYSR